MDLRIESVAPSIAIPGGEVTVRCRGFSYGNSVRSNVLFGGVEANIVSCSDNRIVAKVLDTGSGEGLALRIDTYQTPTYPFRIAQRIASELHPVCNPVVDRQGNLIVTFSGSRGQKVPFSVYRIGADSTNEPFLTDIVNPSGLAFDALGNLYVSSRFDGAVFRVDEARQITKVADNLGIATGLAFDADGFLYVGDRSGSIFKIDPEGSVSVFATLEPSVAAYHLAFSPDGNLFVTGPTLSSQDSIYCVDPKGDVKVFFCGLGRPQGLAFDRSGNLYVGASYRGSKGVVRIDPAGEAEQFIAGPVVVGLVFDQKGNLMLTDTSSVYRTPVDLRGFTVCSE